MTNKTNAGPDDETQKPTGGWQFFGSEKTLQALARRDELQAETIAAAMRALEHRSKSNQPELKRLRREVRRLRKMTRQPTRPAKPRRNERHQERHSRPRRPRRN